MKKLILTLCLLCIVSSAFAEAGPPIPKPKLSITEAVNITNDYFFNKQTTIKDNKSYKKKDYILISATYSNYFRNEKQNDWAWYVKFVHPIANDNSVTYKITGDKKITELEITE